MTCAPHIHSRIRIRDILGIAEMIVFPALVATLMSYTLPEFLAFLAHLERTAITTDFAQLASVAHSLIIIGLVSWTVLCTIRYDSEVLEWILSRHEPAGRQPMNYRADDSRRLTIVTTIGVIARILAVIVGSLTVLPAIILLFEVL